MHLLDSGKVIVSASLRRYSYGSCKWKNRLCFNIKNISFFSWPVANVSHLFSFQVLLNNWPSHPSSALSASSLSFCARILARISSILARRWRRRSDSAIVDTQGFLSFFRGYWVGLHLIPCQEIYHNLQSCFHPLTFLDSVRNVPNTRFFINYLLQL